MSGPRIYFKHAQLCDEVESSEIRPEVASTQWGQTGALYARADSSKSAGGYFAVDADLRIIKREGETNGQFWNRVRSYPEQLIQLHDSGPTQDREGPLCYIRDATGGQDYPPDETTTAAVLTGGGPEAVALTSLAPEWAVGDLLLLIHATTPEDVHEVVPVLAVGAGEVTVHSVFGYPAGSQVLRAEWYLPDARIASVPVFPASGPHNQAVLEEQFSFRFESAAPLVSGSGSGL